MTYILSSRTLTPIPRTHYTTYTWCTVSMQPRITYTSINSCPFLPIAAGKSIGPPLTLTYGSIAVNDWWHQLDIGMQFQFFVCLVASHIITSDSRAVVKSYSTQGGREWCLHQAYKSIFSLVWLWPLSYWPQSWPFHVLVTSTTCVNWHQKLFIYFQNIVRVDMFGQRNERMDERTDNVRT